MRGIVRTCWLGLIALGIAAYSGPVTGAAVPCSACHAAAAAALAQMPHGKLPEASQPECTTCHGDGQAHLAAPGPSTIFNFESAAAAEQNAVCASCHQQAHPAESNAHSAAGIACSSCHGVHSKKRPLAFRHRFNG